MEKQKLIDKIIKQRQVVQQYKTAIEKADSHSRQRQNLINQQGYEIWQVVELKEQLLKRFNETI